MSAGRGTRPRRELSATTAAIRSHSGGNSSASPAGPHRSARRSHRYSDRPKYTATLSGRPGLAHLKRGGASHGSRPPVVGPQGVPVAVDNLFVQSHSELSWFPLVRTCSCVTGKGRRRGTPVNAVSTIKLIPVHPRSSAAGSRWCLHSGMFPCFFRGIVSTLVSSMRRARITRGRVSRGSITSSM